MFTSIDAVDDSNLEADATNKLPAIPAPPVTVRAPVPEDMAAVLDVNLEAPPAYRLPPIPTPPVTTTAPVPTLIAAVDASN